MGRQALDRGTADNVGGESIRSGAGKINDMTLELYRGGHTDNVRYVSLEGTDDDDGKSWGAAKRTVAAALTSLPQVVEGRPYGWVKVGRGTFVETATPMVVGAGLIIEGMGHGPGTVTPTRIQLGNGRDTHLFVCTETASNNHGLVFKDIELDGNKINQTVGAASDLIVLSGGYGCYLMGVALSRSARWGIRVQGGYMNVQMWNITGAACGTATQGGWIFCDNTQNGGVLTLDGGQADQCGVYPIFIQYGQDGGGPMLRFADIKFEQQDAVNQTLHTNCIRFSPRLTGVGNPMFITVENSIFINQSGVGIGSLEAAIYEVNEAGLGASWVIKNCDARDEYTKLFKSAKTGRESFARHVRLLVEHPDNGASATTKAPCAEFAGAGVFVGSGTPAVDAPLGSLYLNRSGGTSTTLYVKTATGTGGWTAK